MISNQENMFIDTHTHLYSEEFDSDRTEMIERALRNGVEKLLLPNIDVESIQLMLDLVDKFPTHCYPMMGLHPGYIKENWEAQLKKIETEFRNNSSKYIAIGEIGMDLYWDKTFVKEQAIAFEKQVLLAKEFDLPIIIHARDAFDEIFEILDRINDENLKGIFHCFTGNLEQAKHILNYGNFLLGIGGVLTYKKAALDEVIQHIDLQHLVLETDAPYLPPFPYRGKRNESSYLVHTAKKLADIHQVTLSEVERITTNNALKLFNI